MAPLIKICGLTTAETLQTALDAGAERVGFVFFPKSPRHLDVNAARRLAEQARGRAVIVALTVDATDAEVSAIVAAVAPDILQLHGKESPARAHHLRQTFGRPVIKALGIAARADLAQATPFLDAVDEILFDAKPPPHAALPGGNGLAFDWRLLAALDLGLPFMLSGGLTPDNVGEALQITRAPAVDVSSGVESAPGIKDPARIEAFIRAARRSAASVSPDVSTKGPLP